MKQLAYFLFLIAFLFACKKESDDSDSPANTQQLPQSKEKKNQALQGELFDSLWTNTSSKMNLDVAGNALYSISFQLFDSIGYHPCYDFWSPYNTAEIQLTNIPPRLGTHSLNESNVEVMSRKGNDSYFVNVQDRDYGYLEITELDTTLNNSVKFYLYLNSPFRGNSDPNMEFDNVVEGWVEGNFCRTTERMFYKDQPLSGKVNGQDWNFMGGIANHDNVTRTYFDLFSTPKDSNCQSFNYNTFPRMRFEINNIEGMLLNRTYPNDSSSSIGNFQTDALSGPNTYFPMYISLKVENIDTVNNSLTAVLDAFSQSSEPIELQGRFTVPYCD